MPRRATSVEASTVFGKIGQTQQRLPSVTATNACTQINEEARMAQQLSEALGAPGVSAGNKKCIDNAGDDDTPLHM